MEGAIAYDHSTKIGNQGDLVKHPALFASLKHILKDYQGAKFSYAETHSGRAEYVIPEGGEWRKGIGEFAKKRRDREASCGHVAEFADMFLAPEITVGRKYLGSNGIAFHCLRRSKSDFSMHLYDSDQAVIDDLIRYFRPWESVGAERRDGYQAVAALDSPNFVLIDPPSVQGKEAHKVHSLISHLKKRDISFLAWAPRTSCTSTPAGTGAQEASTSRNFKREAESTDAKVIGVQWYDKWGHRFPGCWLIVSGDLEQVAWDTVDKVVGIMAGKWNISH